jgi:UDP-glucose 4-epimerase
MPTQLASSSRYVVTGGAGFIGSHLVEALLARGHRVAALDNLSTGSLSNLAAIASHPNFSFHRADVTQPGVVDRLASDADVVIHLAAAVGVRLIVDQPRQTIQTNLDGTQRVLDAAERHGLRLLIASSSEVYGKSSTAPFREDDDVVLGATVRNRWSYAAAKMMGEFLALAYHREAGVDATTLRFFNTIGPRQSGQYGMVVPRFVRQALAGEPITVYGDGAQSRCFCDVRDVVDAVIAVAERPAISGQVLNLGGEREISIMALAGLIRELTGSASEIVRVSYDDAYEPGFEDVPRRYPDTAKLRALTGWRPRFTLEQTLEAIVELETADAGSRSLAASAGV